MVHVYIRNDPLPTTDRVYAYTHMHAQVLRRSCNIRSCFFHLQLCSATGDVVNLSLLYCIVQITNFDAFKRKINVKMLGGGASPSE